MAPEYANWRAVPKNLARAATEFVGRKKKIQVLLNRGDIVFKWVDGTVKDVLPAAEVDEGVLADARKTHSPWHLVRGLPSSRSSQARKKALVQEYGDRTVDKAPRRNPATKKGGRSHRKTRLRRIRDNINRGY